MSTVILLCSTLLLGFSILTQHVLSFESVSWQRIGKQPFLSSRQRVAAGSRLYVPNSLGVAIYSWDDDMPSFRDDEPSFAAAASTTLPPYYRSSVMDCLSREHVAELARLATAFSPPDRALSLHNIEHVEVMEVDDHHIEIEAVVRQDEGIVVALSVPVDFPHRCLDADEFTDCVLHQLEELDHLAEDKLKAIEWETTHQEENDRKWMELIGMTPETLPTWWVYPNLIPGMADECESMRRLLNEEGFQEEVKALAAQTLFIDHPYGRDLLVEQAAIVAVGPAGLLMRARAKLLLPYEEYDETMLLDVPMKFEQQVTTVTALREALLSAIESV